MWFSGEWEMVAQILDDMRKVNKWSDEAIIHDDFKKTSLQGKAQDDILIFIILLEPGWLNSWGFIDTERSIKAIHSCPEIKELQMKCRIRNVSSGVIAQ